MMRILIISVLLGLLVACTPAIAAGVNELTVPQGQYAVLHFGQQVDKAVLPPDAPVQGKPYFMSDNKVLLLRFHKTDHPVQAVVELHDGTTRVLMLHVKKGAPTNVDVPGTEPAKKVSSLPAVPKSRNPAAGVVPVFSAILSGKPLPGWTQANPKSADILRYDRVLATPIAVWAGTTGNRVIEYKVTARNGKTSTLDPSQFYRKGVKAALLNGSYITPEKPGYLFVMTEADHDR